jgi:hypothetical protein
MPLRWISTKTPQNARFLRVYSPFLVLFRAAVLIQERKIRLSESARRTNEFRQRNAFADPYEPRDDHIEEKRASRGIRQDVSDPCSNIVSFGSMEKPSRKSDKVLATPAELDCAPFPGDGGNFSLASRKNLQHLSRGRIKYEAFVRTWALIF